MPIFKLLHRLLRSTRSLISSTMVPREAKHVPPLPEAHHSKHSLIEPINSWGSPHWIMQDTACHRCTASACFKNEPLLRDLGFYFRTATPALPPCCLLHQRRTDSRRRFAQWQWWFSVLAALDDFLNLLFLNVRIYGGAPSAGREDWDLNLDHAHWLACDGCRRFREKALLLLRDGIR